MQKYYKSHNFQFPISDFGFNIAPIKAIQKSEKYYSDQNGYYYATNIFNNRRISEGLYYRSRMINNLYNRKSVIIPINDKDK